MHVQKCLLESKICKNNPEPVAMCKSMDLLQQRLHVQESTSYNEDNIKKYKITY